LYKPEFFNMPLLHEQYNELQRGKFINIIVEEIPLFLIQLYFLFYRDVDSNSNESNDNTRLSVIIALVSTWIGLILNILTSLTAQSIVGEREMKRGYIEVEKPTKNLILHTEYFSKAFSDTIFTYKAFVRKSDTVSKKFEIEVLHTLSDEEFKRRVIKTLARFKRDGTKVYIVVEPEAHQVVQNLIQINRLICGDEDSAMITFSQSKQNDQIRATFVGRKEAVLADVRKICPDVEIDQSLSIKDLKGHFKKQHRRIHKASLIEVTKEVSLEFENSKSLPTSSFFGRVASIVTFRTPPAVDDVELSPMHSAASPNFDDQTADSEESTSMNGEDIPEEIPNKKRFPNEKKENADDSKIDDFKIIDV